MEFTVVVPYTADCPHRQRALAWLVAYYEAQGYPVVVAGAEPFTKGAAAHRAVEETSTEGLIVTDADVYVEGGIVEAIETVRAGAAWVQPHSIVVRLSRGGTEDVLGISTAESRPANRRPIVGQGESRTHHAAAGGGVVVLTRSAWDTSGGIDPRFVGFGGDDISWARALDTLAGPGARLNRRLMHLWHPRTQRFPGNRGSPENERLASAYLDAVGDRDAMWRVIASRYASTA